MSHFVRFDDDGPLINLDHVEAFERDWDADNRPVTRIKLASGTSYRAKHPLSDVIGWVDNYLGGVTS